VIVRSNQFGVRRLKTRRGGPLRPPNKGAHRGAPLRYLFNKDSKEKEEMIEYSAFRIPHSAIGNKGFTLIEIIILIVMAGILLPVIIVPFVASVKGSGQAEWANSAMYLAHYKMEEFMKFDYTDSALNPIALTAYANAPIAGYQWQWEIVRVNSNFATSGTDVGYKRILVRVKDTNNNTYEVYSVATDFQ
jgi:type II secretory pathway pseudopilin PulG